MADPFAPLRRLAGTGNLADADTADLERQLKALTDALAEVPDVHSALREARQAVAVELHEKRGVSYRAMAKVLGRSPTRAKQIVEGERISGKLRPHVTPQDD